MMWMISALLNLLCKSVYCHNYIKKGTLFTETIAEQWTQEDRIMSTQTEHRNQVADISRTDYLNVKNK